MVLKTGLLILLSVFGCISTASANPTIHCQSELMKKVLEPWEIAKFYHFETFELRLEKSNKVTFSGNTVNELTCTATHTIIECSKTTKTDSVSIIVNRLTGVYEQYLKTGDSHESKVRGQCGLLAQRKF